MEFYHVFLDYSLMLNAKVVSSSFCIRIVRFKLSTTREGRPELQIEGIATNSSIATYRIATQNIMTPYVMLSHSQMSFSLFSSKWGLEILVGEVQRKKKLKLG